MVDILGLQLGILDRARDRQRGIFAAGRRCGQVEGVLGRAEAGQLGVDSRAAIKRVLQLLQHQNATRLAAGSAGPPRVERLDRLRRIIAGRRDRADHAEGHRVQRRHAGVGAAAQRHHSVAAVDGARSLANRIGAGGAGQHRRGGRPVQIVGDRHLAGGHIVDKGRQVKGIDAPAALGHKALDLLLDIGGAAERGADVDGHMRSVERVEV